jgi:hypothetical protein
MERVAIYLFRRLTPRVGWPIALLVIGAAACPSIAATDGGLPLPAELLFWAGVVGVILGLRAARARRSTQLLLFGPAALLLGGLFVIAGGRALPPLSLFWSDLANGMVALARWWQGQPNEAAPEFLVGRFFATALPRLWQELQAAPTAGERGATLLVTMIALVPTWVGAVCLGLAVGAFRRSLVASLPLLVALALTTILNGGGGAGLIIGMALLLLLAVATGQLVRERQWDHNGAAYSEELRWDVLGSSTLAVAGILSLALLIPTALPGAIANLFWPDVELPSGIAAIDRQVQRAPVQPTVEVGLSQLPSVELGLSLERAAPETLALRIKTGEPLPAGPWPRYWRARVLTRYSGRQWGADARVAPFGAPLTSGATLPAGVIVQEVENLRANQELLLALPNVIGLDTVVNGERLPDGALAALTSERPLGRYRAISLLPELAEPLNQGAVPPPDFSATLALPQSFSARVRDLAQTIAGQEPTPLAKALALETYLRELPYSYTVRPLPDEGEAVDQFLFEMREGYCTYYASAMVTMARSLNIPARMAIGYATGDYDSALQGYLVREGDAHAWPELLIDGRWLPFEPTPVRPLPDRNPGNATPAPVIEPAEEPAPAAFNWAQFAGPLVVIIGTLGLLLGGRALWQQWRKGPLVEAQLAIEQLGSRAKLPWFTGATLHEYARLIEERNGAEVQPLRELVLLIERIRYGNTPLDSTQIQQLKQARAALEAWAKREHQQR